MSVGASGGRGLNSGASRRAVSATSVVPSAPIGGAASAIGGSGVGCASSGPTGDEGSSGTAAISGTQPVGSGPMHPLQGPCRESLQPAHATPLLQWSDVAAPSPLLRSCQPIFLASGRHHLTSSLT